MSNITVPPGFVVVPNGLAMAHLSVVASPLVFLPPAPPGSVRWYRTTPIFLLAGTLLLFTGWHPTATRWLAAPLPCGSARPSILSDRSTPPLLHLVVVLHCLRDYCQRRGATNVIFGLAVTVRFDVGPPFRWFFYMRGHHLLPSGTLCGRRDLCFCFGERVEGFASLYLYVSMNCFLM